MLRATDRGLHELYDLAMLDLDGVVYISGRAVSGAPEQLDRAREAGLRLAFITNNASRTPERVAANLTELGVPADASDVVTSAQAAARVLVDRLGEGARVVVLGAAGLRQAVVDAGLDPVTVADSDGAAALVTGYGPDLVWRDIMHAAVLVRGGLWWVASNTDMSIPTDFGIAPGHGVLVEMLRRFTEVEPEVAGKPAPPLLAETVRRVSGRRPLMVGDRLDTDIAGGTNAGVDTLLVLTGVTGLPELVAAGPGERPTYLATDLGGLTATMPEVRVDDGTAEVGGWTALVEEGRLRLSGEGAPDDWWRAAAVAAWTYADRTGAVAQADALEPPAGTGSSRR